MRIQTLGMQFDRWVSAGWAGAPSSMSLAVSCLTLGEGVSSRRCKHALGLQWEQLLSAHAKGKGDHCRPCMHWLAEVYTRSRWRVPSVPCERCTGAGWPLL